MELSVNVAVLFFSGHIKASRAFSNIATIGPVIVVCGSLFKVQFLLV